MHDRIHTGWRALVATFILLSWTALPTTAANLDAAGHWEGAVELPTGELAMMVDLEHGEEGWSGTIDIPLQGAEGVPLEDISIEGERVAFAIQGPPGDPTFTGKLADGEIRGEFRQGGGTFPFHLGREAVELPARPQEPQPPFPYRSEEITYENGAVTLAGTLTLPPGPGPFPAAVLITGSGAQDRDETLLGHKPFLVLADHLTRSGIAVLRSDDRGVGGSTGSVRDSTSADFADDALAAVRLLSERSEIDNARIGLIGHSEGGLVAPLAAVRGEGIAYLVLLAGPGVPASELLATQVERISLSGGAEPETAKRQVALLREAFEALGADLAEDALLERLMDVGRRQAALEGADLEDEVIRQQVEMMLSPWFRFFADYDPRHTLEKVRSPVLALNGDLDTQVDTEQNLRAIEAALARGGNEDVTAISFPDLNHLFQHAKTGNPAEYATIEETLAPEVLEHISKWIHQRFGSSSGD